MGEVYLAEHRLLKRPAAIKLIKATQAGDPQAVARFESEVRTTAQLTHPNTVEIYDFGVTEDGTFFYVMEYLPGLDLQDLVDCYGPLDPARAIYLLRQVCGALAEAHARGNRPSRHQTGKHLLGPAGRPVRRGEVARLRAGPQRVAPPGRGPLDAAGFGGGSPLYTSPENVIGDGSPDRRSDVYSLGATAYFLLTGRPPFEGEQPIKVMFAHVNEPVTPIRDLNAAVPEDLADVVQKCLAKRPIDRYQSVEEVDAALAECHQAGDWSIDKSRKWWARHEKPAATGAGGTDEVRMAGTKIGQRELDSAATQGVARDWYRDSSPEFSGFAPHGRQIVPSLVPCLIRLCGTTMRPDGPQIRRRRNSGNAHRAENGMDCRMRLYRNWPSVPKWLREDVCPQENANQLVGHGKVMILYGIRVRFRNQTGTKETRGDLSPQKPTRIHSNRRPKDGFRAESPRPVRV